MPLSNKSTTLITKFRIYRIGYCIFCVKLVWFRLLGWFCFGIRDNRAYWHTSVSNESSLVLYRRVFFVWWSIRRLSEQSDSYYLISDKDKGACSGQGDTVMKRGVVFRVVFKPNMTITPPPPPPPHIHKALIISGYWIGLHDSSDTM